MKNSIILNDSQVTRLQQTGTVTVVDMVKPQPYIDEKNHIKRGDINYGKTIWDEPAIENFTKCCSPYHPGSTLYVREPWMYSDVKCTWDDGNPSQTQILYKYPNSTRPDGVSIEQWNCAKWVNTSHEHAENVENIIEKMEVFGEKWQSPATMPKSAARLFPVVGKVEVGRCKDLSIESIISIGFVSYLREHDSCCDLREQFESFITSKFGHYAWDGNGFLFLTTLKLQK